MEVTLSPLLEPTTANLAVSADIRARTKATQADAAPIRSVNLVLVKLTTWSDVQSNRSHHGIVSLRFETGRLR